MLRREMLNGDPPLTSSDVLHYALDEGLNMIFEEGVGTTPQRAEGHGAPALTADPSCACPTVTAFTAPAGLKPSDAR
jgi:aspartate aminotransferase-like enzyme